MPTTKRTNKLPALHTSQCRSCPGPWRSYPFFVFLLPVAAHLRRSFAKAHGFTSATRTCASLARPLRHPWAQPKHLLGGGGGGEVAEKTNPGFHSGVTRGRQGFSAQKAQCIDYRPTWPLCSPLRLLAPCWFRAPWLNAGNICMPKGWGLEQHPHDLNQSLEGIQLPSTLQALTFCNQSLKGIQLRDTADVDNWLRVQPELGGDQPNTLQTLMLAHTFNRSLPSALQTSTFGFQSLQTLTFGHDFNQSLEGTQLPSRP